ncbi:hypothetical protein R3P38DRAFT_3239577 [Favolaschia claudopus]|uniref:Conserved oligomeric Golgi complex subunit 3 C-terminal domain-containing protein n=1 Tax=Favolaschia claudopus TaxID=2862362 RepID=A0AAV9Z935_9AGAR
MTFDNAFMLLDVAAAIPDASSDEEEDAAAELSVDLDKPRTTKKGLGQLHISHLPKPEDLAYLDPLVGAQTPSGDGVSPLKIQSLKEMQSFNQLFRLPTVDKQETWVPNLSKTVWVLSHLHDFVNPVIFEDIAQEAVPLCGQSLILGSDMIKLKHVGSSPSLLDGELFLVRHPLILKEITNNLDLTHRGIPLRRHRYFGEQDDLSRPGRAFCLAMPRGRREDAIHAKHGIDHDLKRVYEEINQIDAHNARRAREHDADSEITPLIAQTTFQQPAAQELNRAFRTACGRDLRGQAAQLRLYLEDDRTVGVLLEHIQEWSSG